MDDKYLPIKIFEKRKDTDDRDTEGGGNSKPPKWVLQGEELRTKATELVDNLEYVKSVLKTKRDKGSFLPIVIKTAINPDAIAKTHRKEVSKLFETPEGNNVIGFSGDKELLIKVNAEKIIESVEKRISNYEKNSYVISIIDEIDSFEPTIELPKDLSKPLKVKLIDYCDYELNNSVRKLFENVCISSNGIKLMSKVNYTPDLVVYKVAIDSLHSLEDIKEFEGLFSIEPMPSYRITTDSFDSDQVIVVKEPNKGKEYPIVGVLDTGIQDIAHLKPWLIDERHSNYPDAYVDKSHGTFVSGVILYGDDLQSTNYTGLEGCKIFDATVYPDTRKESIDQDELIQNIREAIDKNSDRIKIWNLSLGTQDEAAMNRFSDFGVALDSIQDEFNVIICKSAGNCTNFQIGAPKSRIAQSADSVRSVVVGSIAHTKGEHDMAEENYPSPFTRIGPGPSFIVKPDLVHYGGNAGMYNNSLVSNGVTSFSTEGKLVQKCGTSFSTPRVTAILADLHNNLAEDFDPILLKSLLIHSASFPENLNMPMNEKIKQVGFGVPKSSQSILYNSPHEITLILRDTLEKGNFIEILEFPFPDNLVDEKGFYYGQLIVTLVNQPILDYRQDGEYCQSDLEVALGTYDSKKPRDITKRNIKNPVGRNGSQNILNQACFSRRILNKYSGDFCAKERLLIQYGDKFHPVKKYAIDLNDIKPSFKEHNLTHPKKWYLKIDGLYRDYIENKATTENMELFQDFCLIITIRDPHNEHNVYNDVTQLLQQNNFIHNNIRLRQTVKVSAS